MTELGFELDATGGTAMRLKKRVLTFVAVNKVHEGRPHILDRLRKVNTAISLIPPKVAKRSKIRRCYVVVHCKIKPTIRLP